MERRRLERQPTVLGRIKRAFHKLWYEPLPYDISDLGSAEEKVPINTTQPKKKKEKTNPDQIPCNSPRHTIGYWQGGAFRPAKMDTGESTMISSPISELGATISISGHNIRNIRVINATHEPVLIKEEDKAGLLQQATRLSTGFAVGNSTQKLRKLAKKFFATLLAVHKEGNVHTSYLAMDALIEGYYMQTCAVRTNNTNCFLDFLLTNDAFWVRALLFEEVRHLYSGNDKEAARNASYHEDLLITLIKNGADVRCIIPLRKMVDFIKKRNTYPGGEEIRKQRILSLESPDSDMALRTVAAYILDDLALRDPIREPELRHT